MVLKHLHQEHESILGFLWFSVCSGYFLEDTLCYTHHFHFLLLLVVNRNKWENTQIGENYELCNKII